MKINIRKDNKGFTIVETLIVLAIAAVIIIIVLLAVPALQRTARNNNIKSNASTVTGEISEFESNNNGAFPNDISISSGTLSINQDNTPANACGATSTATTYQVLTSAIGSTSLECTAPLDAITTATVGYSSSTTTTQGTTPAASMTVSPGNLLVVPGATCPSPATGTIVGSSSAFAIFFPIESSSALSSSVGCVQA